MSSTRNGPLRVICTNVYPQFTDEVVQEIQKIGMGELDQGLKQPESMFFESGAFYTRLKSDVRGCDVFIVSPLDLGGNDIWALQVTADTAKRASASRVTAVMPYFEGRQDRKTRPREPITAELALRLMAAAGVDRFVSLDLHTDQIQGMTPLPFDHLFTTNFFIEILRGFKFDPEGTIIMGPDSGSLPRNNNYAQLLGCGVGFVDKRRGADKKSKIFGVSGDVDEKNVFLIDDMISTGKSFADAAIELSKRGAKRIIGVAAHPLFCDREGRRVAVQRIADSGIERLYVSNTVEPPSDLPTNVTVVSAAPLLATAILCVHQGRSVSSLIPK